jgi:hypothetical protein
LIRPIPLKGAFPKIKLLVVDHLVRKMPILKLPVTFQEGPQQYKQTSRKGKRAWRKNVDISEIQDGLENVWDEVAKGYGDLYLIMSPPS